MTLRLQHVGWRRRVINPALSGGGRSLPGVPDPDTAAAPRPRFQRLRDRLAGHPADTTLRRDVPAPLETFIRQWISTACSLDRLVGERVALRLGIDAVNVRVNSRLTSSFSAALGQAPTKDLFDVVDAVLHVHAALDDRNPWNELTETAHSYVDHVVRLDYALADSGSAFTVDSDSVRQLVERVDPTVDALLLDTIAGAPAAAGGFLRDARQHIYGLHPDPTTAYRDAVRAVEEVACPLVLPTDGAATLGKVIAHLRQGGHKWAFALVDRDGADTVDPLVAMLDRLWTGQVSRHGGGQTSRDQTPAEAQAAVHLAATLVQLLGAGALTRRATS